MFIELIDAWGRDSTKPFIFSNFPIIIPSIFFTNLIGKMEFLVHRKQQSLVSVTKCSTNTAEFL